MSNQAPRRVRPLSPLLAVTAAIVCLVVGASAVAASPAAAGSAPYLVKNIKTGSGSSTPWELTALGDIVVFSASGGAKGRELWRSDGTSAGTERVLDIRPGKRGSWIRGITRVGDLAFFIADDGVHGDELWATDGTTLGTHMVRDIVPGPGSGNPQLVFYDGGPVAVDVQGIAFFTTHTDTHLWRSDGTEAGTYFVPGSPNNVGQLTAFGNRVYFTGDNMLWRSDGTLAGTKTVKNSKGAIVKSPAAMAATDSLLFYEFNESKVWRSNGTAAGTFKILDLGPGCTGYNCFPMQLRGDGNLMYFGGGDSLMRSDGTVAGTFRVGPGLDGWPAQMTGAGGAFYFSTYPGLWSTDGAPDSAHLIDLGPADGCCNGLADIDGTLFFSGSQGSGDAYVLKLFRYDAATDTTTEVGPTTAERPYDLTVVGDRVLFSARDSRGAELWAVDL